MCAFDKPADGFWFYASLENLVEINNESRFVYSNTVFRKEREPKTIGRLVETIVSRPPHKLLQLLRIIGNYSVL